MSYWIDFRCRRCGSFGPGLVARVLLAGCLAALGGLAATPLAGAPAGPTLRLSDGRGGVEENSVSDFMYFVPLISPEPVTMATEAGAEHRVRLLSLTRRLKPESFLVKSEFEFIGAGRQQNLIDSTNQVWRHEKKLKQGGKLERVLAAINVQGPGKGNIEIEGAISNGVQTVNEVRMRFNAHGQTSPVSIALHDLDYQDGEFRAFNELVARVNTLTFKRKPGRPKMEVTVASVKPKNAKDNLWQSLKGGIKGLAVNLFIPPLDVEPRGHAAMLDFGAALASQAASFTFPLATNLVPSATASRISLTPPL